MKEFTLNIPALLFPALSLLMIAYTSRFISLANLVRELHKKHRENPSKKLSKQIYNLRKRLIYIRNMQAFAIIGLFTNIVSMFFIFIGLINIAIILFGISLILLAISLLICLFEIFFSVGALSIELSEDEEEICKYCDKK